MRLREMADLIWYPDAPPELPHDGMIPLRHVSRTMVWTAALRIFRAGKLAGRKEALRLAEEARQDQHERAFKSSRKPKATRDGDFEIHAMVRLDELVMAINTLPPPVASLDEEVLDD